MFMADGGASNVRLVGPQGLTHALAALRLYTYRFVPTHHVGPSYRPYHLARTWLSPP